MMPRVRRLAGNDTSRVSEDAKIYVDFLKRDDKGRMLLTTIGTREHLSAAGIELRGGMHLWLYTDDLNDAGEPDDLIAGATVQYDPATERWVAELHGIRSTSRAQREPSTAIGALRLRLGEWPVDERREAEIILNAYADLDRDTRRVRRHA